MMKLLQIHAEFRLPDDFEGSLSDALLELAAYNDLGEANDREIINEDSEVGKTLRAKDVTVRHWESSALQRLTKKHRENKTRLVMCHYLGDFKSKLNL